MSEFYLCLNKRLYFNKKNIACVLFWFDLFINEEELTNYRDFNRKIFLLLFCEMLGWHGTKCILSTRKLLCREITCDYQYKARTNDGIR